MRKYWENAGIRGIKTVAQAAVALIGTEAVGVTDVDWVGVASASALAGIISLLMSVTQMPSRGE